MNKATVTELSSKKSLVLLGDSLFPEVYLEVSFSPRRGSWDQNQWLALVLVNSQAKTKLSPCTILRVTDACSQQRPFMSLSHEPFDPAG